MRRNRVIVEIDALFDTRIGLLLQHKPHFYDRLNFDAYRKRLTNTWTYQIGWDMDEFHGLWKNRTVDALYQSRPTDLLEEGLWGALEDRLVVAAVSMPEEKPVITINFYPYDLSQEEKEEFTKLFIEYHPGFSFKYGSWSPKSLNPTYLRKHWDAMICYNWYDWIEANAENLKNRIPKFQIYYPALLHPDTSKEAIDAIMQEKTNPFHPSKTFLAEYVGVNPLSSELFSCKK